MEKANRLLPLPVLVRRRLAQDFIVLAIEGVDSFPRLDVDALGFELPSNPAIGRGALSQIEAIDGPFSWADRFPMPGTLARGAYQEYSPRVPFSRRFRTSDSRRDQATWMEPSLSSDRHRDHASNNDACRRQSNGTEWFLENHDTHDGAEQDAHLACRCNRANR
jgi:hypothetical protein